MKTKTKTLVLTAVLAALMVLFGLTPVFYIPMPWGVQVTLMCLPIIIGTLVLGLRTGFYLGLLFGLTSFAQLFLNPSPVLAPLFFSPQNLWEPILYLLIVFVPRMAIGPVTWLVMRAFKNKTGKLSIAVCSAAGSLTNSIGFLGMLYLFFGTRIGDIIASIGLPYNSAGAFVLFLGVANGLPEAAVAVVVCLPIVVALRKTYKQKTIGETSE
jgi:uncharacterized membrane protein